MQALACEALHSFCAYAYGLHVSGVSALKLIREQNANTGMRVAVTVGMHGAARPAKVGVSWSEFLSMCWGYPGLQGAMQQHLPYMKCTSIALVIDHR